MPKVFDPRDPAQSFEDQASWKETENPALIYANHIIEMHDVTSFGKDFWKSVSDLANHCEQIVLPDEEFSMSIKNWKSTI